MRCVESNNSSATASGNPTSINASLYSGSERFRYSTFLPDCRVTSAARSARGGTRYRRPLHKRVPLARRVSSRLLLPRVVRPRRGRNLAVPRAAKDRAGVRVRGRGCACNFRCTSRYVAKRMAPPTRAMPPRFRDVRRPVRVALYRRAARSCSRSIRRRCVSRLSIAARCWTARRPISLDEISSNLSAPSKAASSVAGSL